MESESKFSPQKIKILITFLITLLILGGLIPISFISTERDKIILETPKSLEIPEYSIIQSNSLLPISELASENFRGEKVLATVTAYRLVPWETDEDPCILASGINACEINLKERKIVACPRKYPFGTKFLINGEIWECQDRLNIKYDHRFDLLMENKEEVDKWGKRRIEVIKLN